MNRVVMPAGGGDSDTFVGVAVPSTIKRLPKLLDQVKDVKMVTVELVKIAVELIIDPMKPPSSDLDQLSAQFAVAVDVTEQLLAGFLALLRAALKLPRGYMKKQAMSDDLDQLNLPVEAKSPILNAVFGEGRQTINQQLEADAGSFPSLANVQWRVDVSISTSSLKRSLVPSILMQMTLSDGQRQTFQVPVAKFHELRYNTAALLKDMVEIEKRPVFQAAAALNAK